MNEERSVHAWRSVAVWRIVLGYELVGRVAPGRHMVWRKRKNNLWLYILATFSFFGFAHHSFGQKFINYSVFFEFTDYSTIAPAGELMNKALITSGLGFLLQNSPFASLSVYHHMPVTALWFAVEGFEGLI